MGTSSSLQDKVLQELQITQDQPNFVQVQNQAQLILRTPSHVQVFKTIQKDEPYELTTQLMKQDFEKSKQRLSSVISKMTVDTTQSDIQ